MTSPVRTSVADYVDGVSVGERWGVTHEGGTIRVVAGSNDTDSYRPDVAFIGAAGDPGVAPVAALVAAAPELRDLLAEAVLHLEVHPGATCEAEDEDAGTAAWPACEWVTNARSILARLEAA